eukprot:TRINITY_DN38567_c0_g1_i1.p1 TRINITY_DN38567_c0_g1~~TRINITY_DN38567_c0_g1_i1.p1  ORF type:complete len:377 (-),score=90.32 TRINITY_DN38567_c0_g1_i1:71-1201(-)
MTLTDALAFKASWWMPLGKWDVYENLVAPEGFAYPTFERLKYAFVAAVVITVARLVFDQTIFIWIAKACVPKPKVVVFAHTLSDSHKSKLEVFYKNKIDLKAKKGKKTKDGKSKFPPKKEIDEFAGKNDLSVEIVESFLRFRKSNDKADMDLNKTQRKFTESMFKLIMYGLLWTSTFLFILDEPWFRDMTLIWENNPLMTPMALKYHWIYIAQDGLYFHFVVFQFLDTKRSDFWEMFLHHAATIYLISYSYISNKMRIGVWVLLVHDFSDVFLELAKLTKYMELKFIPDVVFVVFAVSFLVTRLILFPFRVIRTCFEDYWTLPTIELGFHSLVYFLCFLVCLHCYWMFLILRMIYKFIAVGEVEKDIRSESEVDEE